MSEMNFNDMMNMISKMDKKELEEKMNQVSKMLGNKSPEEILKQMNNNFIGRTEFLWQIWLIC